MSPLQLDEDALAEAWPHGDSPFREASPAPAPIGDAAVIAAVATGFGALYAGLRILELLIDPKSKEKGQ